LQCSQEGSLHRTKRRRRRDFTTHILPLQRSSSLQKSSGGSSRIPKRKRRGRALVRSSRLWVRG
jgi:hypothetical protein